MLSSYTFLTDHSYSLRPISDDNDEVSLNKNQRKTKKSRKSSNQTNKTNSTPTRTVSIDRSSSDKENNSLILSNSIPNKSPTNKRINKKKSNASSRIQSGKKPISSKTNVKSTPSSIVKKKQVINRKKSKLLKPDSNDILPILSIEERVKLRRTKPLIQPTVNVNEKKSMKKKSQNVQQGLKQIRESMKNSPIKKAKSTKKTTKFFLGSGLDLDNIVLGNRRRRSVQT